MTDKNNRDQRPNGFKTMSILGYISEGLSLAILAFALVIQIAEGHILTAGLSLLYLLLAPAAIVAIYMMTERKSILALNLIRIYLWASIPIGTLYSIVAAAESGQVAENMVSIIANIIFLVPVALYWQQRSHSEYLKSFSH